MITDRDIGTRVTDGKRTGILKALDPKWVDPASPPYERKTYNMAFVWPETGGREWMLNPSTLAPA
ncbi:hypothetical protein OG778_23740 [Streptomyces sp. NBC_00184]|uniref:hypothetical protein n=1 Tax=Streptomyces sp. NBC_00184 TaxID=2975673 RepID=UPI002E2C8702|nr:hypothetical protein [Streptomyces sp. NBC_00184]